MEPPTLVLYEGQVRSACGMGQTAMGPFYCPGDQKLYIDLSFFRDLHTRFRAGAHHIQNQLEPGDAEEALAAAGDRR